MPVFIVLGIFVGILGLFLSSQATIGVALVGVALFCAIMARLAQAHEHHQSTHPSPLIEPANERYRQDRIERGLKVNK